MAPLYAFARRDHETQEAISSSRGILPEVPRRVC